MSSFTISKDEYIKAAGVVAGFANFYRQREFWVYNKYERRNCTAEDYREMFSKFYRMNALSVAQQYGEEPEFDDYEYSDTFARAYAFTTSALVGCKGRELMLTVRKFFRSALYQVENEAFHETMERMFGRIIDQMLDKVFHYESTSWGELNLEEVRA